MSSRAVDPYEVSVAIEAPIMDVPPTPSDLRFTDALASLHDAGSVRVPPWMALFASVASIRPESIGATIDWLVAHRAELERAYDGGRAAKLGLAVLAPEMQYEPELGFLDRPKNDHALRDKYLFKDIVGKRSFFATAVYAMTGIELATRDVEMLDAIGATNLQADRRAWPLAVTRRIAARGGGYAAAVAGGTAMMGAQVLAGSAAADCARFLQTAHASERPVEELVADVVARRERVMGFGRPLVGPDERVPIMKAILAQYGRDALPHVKLLVRADDAFFAHKGLRSTSAAWAAAILCDYGMSPEAVQAVSNYWVSVCVYAQALFAGERAV